MSSNAELKSKAINILLDSLGVIETERFISMIQEEKFDYTKWQQNLDIGNSVRSISQAAMNHRKTEQK